MGTLSITITYSRPDRVNAGGITCFGCKITPTLDSWYVHPVGVGLGDSGVQHKKYKLCMEKRNDSLRAR